MKTKKQTLSDKRQELSNYGLQYRKSLGDAAKFYSEEDVKEAVMELKDTSDEEIINLATFMHNTYEILAEINGWKTQENCKVKFEDLPSKNKEVMLQLSCHIKTRENIRIDEIFGEMGK
jgi:hypothetical protein